MSRRPFASVSLPRTWSHMPNHARFGPAMLLKKSKAPSGFVLSSMKPWVMNSGTGELLTFAIRSRCAQNALAWSLFVPGSGSS